MKKNKYFCIVKIALTEKVSAEFQIKLLNPSKWRVVLSYTCRQKNFLKSHSLDSIYTLYFIFKLKIKKGKIYFLKIPLSQICYIVIRCVTIYIASRFSPIEIISNNISIACSHNHFRDIIQLIIIILRIILFILH